MSHRNGICVRVSQQEREHRELLLILFILLILFTDQSSLPVGRERVRFPEGRRIYLGFQLPGAKVTEKFQSVFQKSYGF